MQQLGLRAGWKLWVGELQSEHPAGAHPSHSQRLPCSTQDPKGIK